MAFLLKRINIIEKTIIFALLAFTIAKWTSSYLISPDSIAYIDAALSYAKSGSFLRHLLSAQRASVSLAPEIYNGYPVGFPLLIAIFYKILSDIFYATLIMQSIIFVFLYYALYKVLLSLKLKPQFRIIVFIFLTFSRIYQENFSYFLTEPLFLAMSLLGLYHGLAIQDVSKPFGKHVAYATVFCGLSALLRYAGTLNSLFILYPIYVRIKEDKASGVFFLALKYSIFPVAAGFLTTGIYFLRNYFLLNTVGTVHNKATFHLDKFMALHPAYFSTMFGGSFIFLLIFIAFFAFFLSKKSDTKKTFYNLAQTCILAALSIWQLTVFTVADAVGHRFLGFSYMIFYICVVYAVATASSSATKLVTRNLAYAFFAVFIIFNAKNYFNPMRINFYPLVRIPEERILWKDLLKDEKFSKIDYLITSYYDYYHSMFSQKTLIFSQSMPGYPLMTEEMKKIVEANKSFRFASVYRCRSSENKEWREYLSKSANKEIEPIQKGEYCFYFHG